MIGARSQAHDIFQHFLIPAFQGSNPRILLRQGIDALPEFPQGSLSLDSFLGSKIGGINGDDILQV
jgi:hypothetical protein